MPLSTKKATAQTVAIPYVICCFHELSHTFATRTLECGMDVRTLSEILRHANPTITLKHYSHSMMEHKIAMINELLE